MKSRAVALLVILSIVALAALGLWQNDPLLLLGAWPDDPLALLFDEEAALTFEGALAIAERLDRIGDELEMPSVPHTTTDITLLAIEIVPYYHYDNIATGSEHPMKFPLVVWDWFKDEESLFHTLGRCMVGDRPVVYLNARFANPWSSWYGKPAVIATLVHELGHAQGIYRRMDPDSEPATQLATLEVLAAMTRDGNVWGLPAFVRELQGYATDYAWSLALHEGRLDEFEAFRERVGSGIYSQSKYERAMAHWSDRMDRLKYILKAYGEKPYVLTVQALNAPAYQSVELEPLPNRIHRLNADDTAWIVQHLYAMARAYPELVEERAARQ